MSYQGTSRKMKVTLGDSVQYSLRLGETEVPLNAYLGQAISLKFTGEIHCISCGRKTNKSFAQGLCFPCMRDSAENSECIIRPELCRGHLGEGRDVEWEQKNHVQPHTVYLAVSSAVKVGVTRLTQVPTRWIDQGASMARVIAHTPHRCAAGELEVALKSAFTDRTSWQKMLKNDVLYMNDWAPSLEAAKNACPEDLVQYWDDTSEPTEINYPVLEYPEKVKSLSFDKLDQVEGTLLGIKGQYLLFDENRVLNIRKHNGYGLRFESLG